MFDHEIKETNRLLEANGHTLRRIAFLLEKLLPMENEIMLDLTTLTAAVARNGTVEASAVTLLQGLKGHLDAAIEANRAGDPTALAALSTSLGAETDALAAAIAANPLPPDTGTAAVVSEPAPVVVSAAPVPEPAVVVEPIVAH